MTLAARVGDFCGCPQHGGGPIVPPGATTVLIGGTMAAARLGDRVACGVTCDPTTAGDADAAKLIQDNAQEILDAAEEFGVDPAIVAGVIYAEQALNVNLLDAADGIVGFYGILDTSVGIGQVKVSTAEFLEEEGYISPTSASDGGWSLPIVGTIHGTETMAREKRLEDNSENVRYVAAYIKYFEDLWAPSFPEIGNRPDILGTLYNLGHEQTSPNSDPQPNDFGQYVSDNYALMTALLGLPCPLDTIASGSATVIICGAEAARVTDMTVHGGLIAAGCATVLIGVHPILQAVMRSVNPAASTINCGNILDAVYARLAGTDPNAVAPDALDGSFTEIEARFGTTLNWGSSFEEAFEAVRNGGDGTTAVVGIVYSSGSSHVVIMTNQGGAVGIIEAQDWGAGNPAEIITNPVRADQRYNSNGGTDVGWGHHSVRTYHQGGDCAWHR